MTTCPECLLAIEERAAILEYDAGLDRAAAERRAVIARCPAHPTPRQQSQLFENPEQLGRRIA